MWAPPIWPPPMCPPPKPPLCPPPNPPPWPPPPPPPPPWPPPPPPPPCPRAPGRPGRLISRIAVHPVPRIRIQECMASPFPVRNSTHSSEYIQPAGRIAATNRIVIRPAGWI